MGKIGVMRRKIKKNRRAKLAERSLGRAEGTESGLGRKTSKLILHQSLMSTAFGKTFSTTVCLTAMGILI